MQSSGGVVSLGAAVGGAAACVLSGPAGGVVGAGFAARASGYADVLTFDMGGTSTDVAPIVGGEASTTTESVVAGVPIRLPVVDVHTVSAGGGSIAWADAGGALRVGPRSAGADPGPAAYGRGGEDPTVTDANLVLGHLQDGATLGGELELDAATAEAALERLGAQLGLDAVGDGARGRARRRRRDGACAARHQRAARAGPARLRARRVRRRGRDARLRAGRGARHGDGAGAARGGGAVARSAWRSPTSGATTSRRRSDRCPSSTSPPSSRSRTRRGPTSTTPRCAAVRDLRYRGQSFELTVDAGSTDDLGARFHEAHERRYGYRMDGEAVEVVALRVIATVEVEKPELHEEPGEAPSDPDTRRMHVGDEWAEVPAYRRDALGAGRSSGGPVPGRLPRARPSSSRPGWSGAVDDAGTVVLTR